MAKGSRHELKGKGKGKIPPRARDKTRSHNPHLIEDPALEERLLAAQLAQNGLYVASTIGDGNCLFRALSDQMYGSESSHLKLRAEICEQLANHSERYRLFVDEDEGGGFNGHVAAMRQPGTYGTNIELSAFVHRYNRSIKVFQPGLVYVLAAEDSPSPSAATGVDEHDPSPASSAKEDEGPLTPREQRLKTRNAKLKGKGRAPPPPEKEEEEDSSPLAVAYHSWEHYSSLRSLTGPHSGLPRLRNLLTTSKPPTPSETPPPPPDAEDSPEEVRKHKHDTASLPTPPSSDTPPVKRRPGRPRKHPPPDPLHSLPHALALAVPRTRPASPSFDSQDESMARRSRQHSPASSSSHAGESSSSIGSPAELDRGDDSEMEDTVHAGTHKISGKVRRGPTAREKKELQRKRRLERRREKAVPVVPVSKGGSDEGAGAPLLSQVRELFI